MSEIFDPSTLIPSFLFPCACFDLIERRERKIERERERREGYEELNGGS